MQKHLLPKSIFAEAKKETVSDKNESNRLAILLLSIIIIGLLLADLLWIWLHSAPPLNDDNQNLIKASLHFNSLCGSFKDSVIIALLGRGDGFYPPCLFNETSIFFAILGKTESAARISIFPFFMLMAFSTYGFGKRLWGVWAGFTAAAAAMSSCWIQEFTHSYFYDLPLTSCVIFHFYAMLASKHLTDKKGSILWGLSLGLGFMTKWTFLLWIIIPELIFILKWLFAKKNYFWGKSLILLTFIAISAAFCYWRTFFPTTNIIPSASLLKFFSALLFILITVCSAVFLLSHNSKHLFPGALGIIIASLIIIPWYTENTNSIFFGFAMAHEVNSKINKIWEFYKNWESMRESIYFLNSLIAISVITGLRKKARLKLAQNLLAAGTGFILMNIFFGPAQRYVLPATPPLCVLAFSWISALKKRIQWVIPIMLAPIFIWQAFFWMPEFDNLKAAVTEKFDKIQFPKTADPPILVNSGILELTYKLADSNISNNRHKNIIWIASNHDKYYLQSRVFQFYSIFYNIPIETYLIEMDKETSNTDKDIFTMLTQNADYFLAIWKYDDELNDILTTLARYGWETAKIEKIDFPDNSHLAVYEHANLHQRANKKALPASSAQPGN